MKAENLRYIVFLIDSKVKEHDGKVYCSIDDAREYAQDVIDEKYANKAVIGMFYMDQNAEIMSITMVDTIGFKGDKKNVNQLTLFNF
jgi:hypothetical protein